MREPTEEPKVRKRKSGKLIRVFETDDTYRDHRGKEKPLFAYKPTDCPQNTYTSHDMAFACAVYEHGTVRVRSERKWEPRPRGRR